MTAIPTDCDYADIEQQLKELMDGIRSGSIVSYIIIFVKSNGGSTSCGGGIFDDKFLGALEYSKFSIAKIMNEKE